MKIHGVGLHEFDVWWRFDVVDEEIQSNNLLDMANIIVEEPAVPNIEQRSTADELAL